MERNMPNNIAATSTIEEFEETDEFGKDDFGFILGPDGELKSIMIPEDHVGEFPDEVTMILNIYGINDINELNNRHLH
jgi:hypothetical protein